MALLADQIASLAAELADDPAGLGYATYVAAGQDGDIEALINAATGPGAGTVTLASVPRDAVLLGLSPALLSIGDKSAEVKDRWGRILGVIQAADSLTINASNLAMFGLAILDGLMTQPQAEAIYRRTGSRAEVLFGAGSRVDTSDIAKALRG